MYRLTRISSEPASPLNIKIAKPEGEDAGLTNGGCFLLDPGDTVQVDAYVAGVIMKDPELAAHFECLPPWKDPRAVPEPEPAPALAPVTESPVKRSGSNPPPRTQKPTFTPPGQGKRSDGE